MTTQPLKKKPQERYPIGSLKIFDIHFPYCDPDYIHARFETKAGELLRVLARGVDYTLESNPGAYRGVYARLHLTDEAEVPEGAYIRIDRHTVIEQSKDFSPETDNTFAHDKTTQALQELHFQLEDAGGVGPTPPSGDSLWQEVTDSKGKVTLKPKTKHHAFEVEASDGGESYALEVRTDGLYQRYTDHENNPNLTATHRLGLARNCIDNKSNWGSAIAVSRTPGEEEAGCLLDVKIDGTTIVKSDDGVLSATGGSKPIEDQIWKRIGTTIWQKNKSDAFHAEFVSADGVATIGTGENTGNSPSAFLVSNSPRGEAIVECITENNVPMVTMEAIEVAPGAAASQLLKITPVSLTVLRRNGENVEEVAIATKKDLLWKKDNGNITNVGEDGNFMFTTTNEPETYHATISAGINPTTTQETDARLNITGVQGEAYVHLWYGADALNKTPNIHLYVNDIDGNTTGITITPGSVTKQVGTARQAGGTGSEIATFDDLPRLKPESAISMDSDRFVDVKVDGVTITKAADGVLSVKGGPEPIPDVPVVPTCPRLSSFGEFKNSTNTANMGHVRGQVRMWAYGSHLIIEDLVHSKVTKVQLWDNHEDIIILTNGDQWVAACMGSSNQSGALSIKTIARRDDGDYSADNWKNSGYGTDSADALPYMIKGIGAWEGYFIITAHESTSYVRIFRVIDWQTAHIDSVGAHMPNLGAITKLRAVPDRFIIMGTSQGLAWLYKDANGNMATGAFTGFTSADVFESLVYRAQDESIWASAKAGRFWNITVPIDGGDASADLFMIPSAADDTKIPSLMIDRDGFVNVFRDNGEIWKLTSGPQPLVQLYSTLTEGPIEVKNVHGTTRALFADGEVVDLGMLLFIG
jgi:hypothetical protein